MFKKLGIFRVEIAAHAISGNKIDKRMEKIYLSMYEGKNPSAEDIENLKKSRGKIPEDYKEFLKSKNGGISSATLRKTKSNERVIG